MTRASIHTDLAYERCKADENDDGVKFKEEMLFDTQKHTLDITTQSASEKYGMPIGRYTTLLFPPLWDMDDCQISSASNTLRQTLHEYLQRILGDKTIKGSRILVVGLGNRYLTADAIGPMTVKNISATNHIAEYESDVFAKYFNAKIITVAPGVMSQTGLESADIIRGICENNPIDAVIAIDALAARSCERLATTIQISNTGITPGSGINNARNALNESTLGTPTIAIGVPTVVDSATLITDALEKANKTDISDDFFDALNDRRFFVSPKECDTVTENASRIISDAINSVLNENLFEERKEQ